METIEQMSLASLLLPRKTGTTLSKPLYAQPAKFYSNIFQIKLKKNCGEIYQYSLDISPQIPADSVGLTDKIIKTIRFELKKSIGFLEAKGAMAWGRKEMKTVLTLKAEFSLNSQNYSFEVLVKPIKRLGLQAYMNQSFENLPSILQVLNINAKTRLRQNKMIQLFPGSYFQSQKINNNIVQGKLNVWRGYDITIALYDRNLYLQVDPCSRILRQESFLTTIEQQKKRMSLQEINLKYKGSPLLRRYGNPQIFKLEQIDYKKSPKDKFYWSKQGKQVSYIYYYQNEYGAKIKYENQPLIKAFNKKMKNINKQGFSQFVYLVPQLVSLTGLTDQQRTDKKLMKNLAQFTKLSAQERIKETRKILGELYSNDLMFDIDQNPKVLSGFKLKTPSITLGKNRMVSVINGEMKIKQQIMDPFEFMDIILCYSIGKYEQEDQSQIDQAYNLIRTAAKTYGISVSDKPVYIEVQNGNKLQDWTKQMLNQKKKFRKDQKMEMFIFILKANEKSLYSGLKKFVNQQFDTPSQMITRRILSHQFKGRMSAAGKIALQMNVKAGHGLWAVQNNHPRLKQERIAVAGIATSNGKRGLTLAFSGTTSRDLTKYHIESRLIKKKEDFSVSLFQVMFVKWLQNYYRKNDKKFPGLIVIYRQGLNEAQAKINSQCQVRGIIEAIQQVKLNAKQNNYLPVIQYILVNKKPNSRIYQGNGKNQFYNPDPGSIIFEGLSQGEKGFHLASAAVREGTCTPVSFKIGYESTPDFPLQALSELTYNQTYSYFNWTGSVRVPAPLQYANKLAKQFSDIGGELSEQGNADIKSKLFFL